MAAARDRHDDGNGNLTNDGQFVYVWDNADRLKEVRTLDNSLVMSCRYDGLGRRRERIVAAGHEGGPSTNRYVYDDWRVLEVRDGANGVLESYTHGPDLSGTIGGAGGIGGILSVTLHQSSTISHCFLYDGNGNVVRLADTNRAIVSALEYGPFGTVLVKSGSYTPRYQFSSKEFDAAVGLNYYGYRYYSPEMGRWPSRDPIGEFGGLNTLCFAGNAPATTYDIYGLDTHRVSVTFSAPGRQGSPAGATKVTVVVVIEYKKSCEGTYGYDGVIEVGDVTLEAPSGDAFDVFPGMSDGKGWDADISGPAGADVGVGVMGVGVTSPDSTIDMGVAQGYGG